jgi:hypothetical protein
MLTTEYSVARANEKAKLTGGGQGKRGRLLREG